MHSKKQALSYIFKEQTNYLSTCKISTVINYIQGNILSYLH